MGRTLKPRLEDEVFLVIVEGEVVFRSHFLAGDRCAAPTSGDLGP